MVMVMKFSMEWKEIKEAIDAGIPNSIIGKFSQGIEPNEKEKGIINKLGKVYVEAHKKDGVWIKPQLRDLPTGSKAMVRSSSSREESFEDAKVTVSVYKGRRMNIENLDYFKVRLPGGEIYKIKVAEVEPSDSPREDWE